MGERRLIPLDTFIEAMYGSSGGSLPLSSKENRPLYYPSRSRLKPPPTLTETPFANCKSQHCKSTAQLLPKNAVLSATARKQTAPPHLKRKKIFKEQKCQCRHLQKAQDCKLLLLYVGDSARAKYQQLKDGLKLQSWLQQLRLDLPRSNSLLPDYLHPNLESVVRVSLAETGLSYLQGMNQLAAVLLLHLKIQFKTAAVLSRVLIALRPLYEDENLNGLSRLIQEVQLKLARQEPRLHQHLLGSQVQLPMFLTKWLVVALSRQVAFRAYPRFVNELVGCGTGMRFLADVVVEFLAGRKQLYLSLEGGALLRRLLQDQQEDEQHWQTAIGEASAKLR